MFLGVQTDVDTSLGMHSLGKSRPLSIEGRSKSDHVNVCQDLKEELRNDP